MSDACKKTAQLEDLNRTLVALTQRDIDASCMYCFKTTCLKVESGEEIAWTLDGEYGGRHTEVVVENSGAAAHHVP